MNSHFAEDIFKSGTFLETNLLEKTTHEVNLIQFNFIPCGNSGLSSKRSGDISSWKLVQSYETLLDNVTNIIYCDDGTKFIGSNYNSRVQRVVLDNNEVKVGI